MHRLLICWLLILWSAFSGIALANTSTTADQQSSPLNLFNREVFVFRADFLGAAPNVRAMRARQNIEDILSAGKPTTVEIREHPDGRLVMLGGTAVFVITAGDIDPLTPLTLDQLGQQTQTRLSRVLQETDQARNWSFLLKAMLASLAATTVFALILLVIRRLRLRLAAWLLEKTQRKAETLRIGDIQLIDVRQLIPFIQRLLDAARWLLIALLAYEWLSFVLSRFPYTRAWGERLNDYLLGVLEDLAGGILSAIPGLGVALAIFLIARFSVNFLGHLLKRIARKNENISWLTPDTLPVTRRLFNVGIWLFAIAMAYPYLPGSETEAFRGLSVLLGLMISLGASSVVGQGAAGLILTYTRPLRTGEYVRIGENEGTVTRIGVFTTSIRTGLGEELTLPNSLITNSVTRNYSRAVDGPGYIVDTVLTIGYDTPWRQVEAMLIEAARRTPGILETPTPRVIQTALSDYYPEYRLIAQAIPSQPRPRAEVLSQLHANIQDVFNSYGVQIMSPHYMADTATAKIVPPADWSPPPASPAETGQKDLPNG
jgi:small-conductance mechanosensitive channel